MATTEKIDQLDKKILNILSRNARIPFKDVAAECGVSRAAIHQRVQHLIEGNVIMGSGFDVNPKSLGYSTCTYVGITLERGSMYKDVVECLQHIPEIVECHFTTGPYTMLVKLYARDNEQLMHLLNGRLQDIPGVVATETLISLEQSIKREIPVSIDEQSMNEFDWKSQLAQQVYTKYPEYTERPLIGITGNYGDLTCKLAEGYYDSVIKAGGVPIIIPPTADTDVIINTLENISGLILSGGSDFDPRYAGEEKDPKLGEINEKRDLPNCLSPVLPTTVKFLFLVSAVASRHSPWHWMER